MSSDSSSKSPLPDPSARQAMESVPSREEATAASASGSRPDPLGAQPTVISSRPPLGPAYGTGPLHPGELGRQLVGRRLAHFELVEFVGGGGMGAVFRATDTMLNRTVAVKVLSRDQGQDEETVRRFRNEAQSAARLDHENIARVYFVGEEDGWYFIVFEFIEGQNVRDLVAEQGPLSVEQALNITLQVAAALDHAAQREVVHRDIKPSNVLLTDTGRAKLVDMGLARLTPLHADEHDLTASGVTLGTFDYISPEQARDPRTADVRSDIYSLGCTLYFMLTGRPPFADGTVLQKLLSHSSEPPPDPRTWRADLPDELLPVLNRMLAKNPADRYAKPSELIRELVRLGERLGLPTALRLEPIWVQPERRPSRTVARHLPWIVPTVLMVGLLIADPTWLTGASAPPPVPVWEPPAGSRMTPAASDGDPAGRSLGSTQEGLIAELPLPAPAVRIDPTSADRIVDEGSVPGRSRGTDSEAASEAEDNLPTDGTGLGREGTETPPAVAANSGSRTSGPSNTRLRQVIVTSDFADAEARQAGLVVGDLITAFQSVLEDPSIETIELRENGRLPVPPITLDLANRNLRLVAADGYSPVLSFRTALSVSDPSFQGMLRIRNGSLRLEGLHLELVVPTDTLEGEWSLMQLERAESVRLLDCTVTVRNSYGGRFSNLDHVAVFHVVQPPRDDMFYPEQDRAEFQTEIDLVNCVIRGETTVLRAKEAVPLSFRWHNGLLVTTERLVTLGGVGEPPASGERVILDLAHLTAIVDQGLAEFSASPSAPYLMNVSIWCSSSILMTQRWAPLITQSGQQSLTAQMAQLDYSGEQNFYEGVETFWRIVPSDPARAEDFDFEMWRSHWTAENVPQWQRVKWQSLPDRNRPAHEHRVADYALNPSDNPAIKSSPDRSDAGFRSSSLPRLPEPETELPPKTRPLYPF